MEESVEYSDSTAQTLYEFYNSNGSQIQIFIDSESEGEQQQNHAYNFTYCGESYEKFGRDLKPFVLNFNLVICFLGILTNILNILVFSRRSMKSPINLILAGIALSDIIVMLAFIPEYFAQTKYAEQNHPYAVSVIWIAHEYFLSVFHPVSVWMTTTMAVFRYIACVHPLKCRSLCTMKRAKIIICLIFIFNILITIPGYVAAHIVEGDETKTWKEGGCGSKYCAKWKDFSVLRKIEFIYHGFASKIVTSIIMTFVNIRLIVVLFQAHNTRKKMTMTTKSTEELANNDDTNSNYTQNGSGKAKETTTGNETSEEGSRREFDRMTQMIVVVLVIFLSTELPPSILHILEVFYGPKFYFECRRPLHFLILTMYLLSGVLNFAVYTIMSRNFRANLFQLLNIQKFSMQNNSDQVKCPNSNSTNSSNV